MAQEPVTNIDRLVDLEQQRTNIVGRTRNTWEFVKQLKSNIGDLVGTRVGLQGFLTPDTLDFAEACGIPKKVAEGWGGSMITDMDGTIHTSSQETSFKQYADFLDDFETDTPVE